MANICTTDYCISGSKELLEKFNHKLTLLDIESKCETDLDEILDIFNIESKNIYSNGVIYYYDFNKIGNNIWISTTSKWEGCHDVFNIINEKIFNNELTISYREIEPEGCIFDVYDKQDVFTEECMVSSYGFENLDECDNFYNFETAIELWFDEMKYYLDDCENFKKLTTNEKIEYINNYEYNDDKFFQIYKINFLN